MTAAISCLGALRDKPHAHLGHPLTEAKNLIPSTNCRLYACTATRTATGLVRTGTQWTKGSLWIIENRLNKANYRTHQDGLERAQANS